MVFQSLPSDNNEVPNFGDIAKEIIKKAFRSAICIDNDYASAYSVEEKLDKKQPEALYNSFREVGHCDIDIFNFKSIEESWKEHMLENKDLMILDWELDNGATPEEKYASTIKILNAVIESQKIPFIVIYSNAPILDVISNILLKKFNPINEEKYKKFVDAFTNLKHVTDDEVDFDTFKENNSTLFFEYIHNYSKRSEIEQNISQILTEQIQIKEALKPKINISEKVFKMVKDIFNLKNGEELLYLSFLVLREVNTFSSKSLKRIEMQNPGYFLNESTTIIIFQKKKESGGIEPTDLFNEFSNALINSPHNFLSLLALEFKDNLKEYFNSIGSKFSTIDEKAFFYHMRNYKRGNDFDIKDIYDFILKGWISELYTQKVNENSKVLNHLKERYETLDVDNINIDDSLIDELVKYSAYISNSNLDITNKSIGFGDVFYNDKDEYFICITPHCDCLRPEKIKGNFYFIKGIIETDKKSALENAEKDFFSFIFNKEKHSTYCIRWKCKPFTSFFKSNTAPLKICYSGKQSDIKYITTLKENYAQRISNESFSYGYRVGVDLPHI